jgi:hypothetical protein
MSLFPHSMAHEMVCQAERDFFMRWNEWCSEWRNDIKKWMHLCRLKVELGGDKKPRNTQNTRKGDVGDNVIF